MTDKYTPGQDCNCHAYSESECGCGADWTPSEVYELREQLAAERALADRLAAALTDCMGDSAELLGERSWWKDEPRKSYQEDYNKTLTNCKRADSVIQQWKEARSEI